LACILDRKEQVALVVEGVGDLFGAVVGYSAGVEELGAGFGTNVVGVPGVAKAEDAGLVVESEGDVGGLGGDFGGVLLGVFRFDGFGFGSYLEVVE